MSDRFHADVSGDDIKLSPASCVHGVCICSETLPYIRYGMTAAQAQEFVAKYYQMKAEYVRGMTTQSFLLDYAGIYPT